MGSVGVQAPLLYVGGYRADGAVRMGQDGGRRPLKVVLTEGSGQKASGARVTLHSVLHQDLIAQFVSQGQLTFALQDVAGYVHGPYDSGELSGDGEVASQDVVLTGSRHGYWEDRLAALSVGAEWDIVYQITHVRRLVSLTRAGLVPTMAWRYFWMARSGRS